MNSKPRFLDDLAGLAGGAFSAAMGVREEIHAIIRTQVNELVQGLQLVRKEDFDVLRDMTAKARMQQEKDKQTIAHMQHQIIHLEKQVKKLSQTH